MIACLTSYAKSRGKLLIVRHPVVETRRTFGINSPRVGMSAAFTTGRVLAEYVVLRVCGIRKMLCR